MSKNAGRADRGAAFAALRDHPHQYNWYLGTADALIAAGVIDAYMLKRGFTHSKEINRRDDLGISVSIRQCANGLLRVKKATGYEQDRRAAKTIEASVGGIVSGILDKFARPPVQP